MPNSELLIRGAEALEADAANPKGVKFDLRDWAYLTESYLEGNKLSVGCGTAACAMGLFVLQGTFAKEGLFNGANDTDIALFPAIIDDIHIRQGMDAAAHLFGLTMAQTFYLFDADRYTEKDEDGYEIEESIQGAETELRVAKRMREVARLDTNYRG